MRRTASPSRRYGRYAVGLRPSLDPDAYFDAPNQDQEAPKQAKQTPAVVLTGPTPSGMTSENAARASKHPCVPANFWDVVCKRTREKLPQPLARPDGLCWKLAHPLVRGGF